MRNGLTDHSLLRSAKQHLYVVEKPDVYKSAVSDVYIVFGEAKAEDMSAIMQQQMAQQAAQQEMMANLAQQEGFASQAGGSDEKKKEAEEEEDDGSPIDETGLDTKDIELIIQQTSCSRRKAVKALKESDGDLINAIMAAS